METRAALKLDESCREAGCVGSRANQWEDAPRGQTLPLKPAARAQLKVLAVEQGKPSHDLLIEPVNMLFDHYGNPVIAGYQDSNEA